MINDLANKQAMYNTHKRLMKNLFDGLSNEGKKQLIEALRAQLTIEQKRQVDRTLRMRKQAPGKLEAVA